MVVVVVTVAVAPGPIFFLFARRNLAEIAMFVAMVFPRPAMVVNNFVIVPDVVVAVIGIVDPIIMMSTTSHAEYRTHKRGG
jgi:hypothetical protein